MTKPMCLKNGQPELGGESKTSVTQEIFKIHAVTVTC